MMDAQKQQHNDYLDYQEPLHTTNEETTILFLGRKAVAEIWGVKNASPRHPIKTRIFVTQVS